MMKRFVTDSPVHLIVSAKVRSIISSSLYGTASNRYQCSQFAIASKVCNHSYARYFTTKAQDTASITLHEGQSDNRESKDIEYVEENGDEDENDNENDGDEDGEDDMEPYDEIPESNERNDVEKDEDMQVEEAKALLDSLPEDVQQLLMSSNFMNEIEDFNATLPESDGPTDEIEVVEDDNDSEGGASILPDWVHGNTQNPEFIPQQPNGKYPFIPILRTPSETAEASVLHRLLHYTRLQATREFIRIEHRRKQFENRRKYRNLNDVKLTFPTSKALQKSELPPVKNLPKNMSPSLVQKYHPHNIPTDPSWIESITSFFRSELERNPHVHGTDKVQWLKQAHSMLLATYYLMQYDRSRGYYRICMGDQYEEKERPPRPIKRTRSTLLKEVKI